MASSKRSKKVKGALDRFEPGGDLGPVQDRNQHDERLKSLPAAEKQLTQESARFADLCQYFERQKMEVPVDILDQLGRASRLAIPERVRSDEEAKPEIDGVPRQCWSGSWDSAVTGGHVSVAILRIVTDLPDTPRISTLPACAAEASCGVIGSCLAYSVLTLLVISIPSFQTVPLGRLSNARTQTFAFGGNRLLFVSKTVDSAPPDSCLLTLSSERYGAFDCRSPGWKSETVFPIAVSQLRGRGEALLLMRARRLGEDFVRRMAAQSGGRPA